MKSLFVIIDHIIYCSETSGVWLCHCRDHYMICPVIYTLPRAQHHQEDEKQRLRSLNTCFGVQCFIVDTQLPHQYSRRPLHYVQRWENYQFEHNHFASVTQIFLVNLGKFKLDLLIYCFRKEIPIGMEMNVLFPKSKVNESSCPGQLSLLPQPQCHTGFTGQRSSRPWRRFLFPLPLSHIFFWSPDVNLQIWSFALMVFIHSFMQFFLSVGPKVVSQQGILPPSSTRSHFI